MRIFFLLLNVVLLCAFLWTAANQVSANNPLNTNQSVTIGEKLLFIHTPAVNRLNKSGATIIFQTSHPTQATITIKNQTFKSGPFPQTNHMIIVNNLPPDTDCSYKVQATYGDQTIAFEDRLHTVPKEGTRKPFSFAYGSDTRSDYDKAPNDVGYGVNTKVLSHALSFSRNKKNRFFQLTGDMIMGPVPLSDSHDITRQYQTWRQVTASYRASIPIYVTMGNHEAYFSDRRLTAEEIYTEQFLMPTTSLNSEDGSIYDISPHQQNFPTYKNSVYYYVYDNVAMIVLNSHYDYSYHVAMTFHKILTGHDKENEQLTEIFKFLQIKPDEQPKYGVKHEWNWLENYKKLIALSGNIHGYIMDNQIEWLEETFQQLNNDTNIDHIFVTQHTPMFPNNSHLNDGLWHYGSNMPRPIIDGKPTLYGNIEQRDRYLRIIQSSPKFVAMLTGDEHNYHRTHITGNTKIYLPECKSGKEPEQEQENSDMDCVQLPAGYKRVTIKHPFWQICNGAVGAPFVSKDKGDKLSRNLLWKNSVEEVIYERNVLVMFNVDGKKITMEVWDFDNEKMLDRVEMRK